MAQLPSTATIKDIIAALQTMECINQKADLASAVGSPASASDAVATIITKLQNAKNTMATNLTAKGVSAVGSESLSSLAAKINSLPTSGAKRWANGANTTGSSLMTFTKLPSSSELAVYLEVTGLTFKPSVIIVTSDNPNYRYAEVVYYTDLKYESTTGIVFTRTNDNVFAVTGNAYINATGFRIPASGLTTNTPARWIAFE